MARPPITAKGELLFRQQLNAALDYVEGLGGGAPAWGAITGTLTDQTDLDTALDGKAAATHSHATSDVTGLDTALSGKQPLATVLTNTTAAFTTAQETKLAGIATGAQVNVGTNLTYTAATRIIASDTGTDATLPLVTSGDAGLAPASGGGTANFLRADGTWVAPTASATATDFFSQSFASQGPGFATDTYLTGSSILIPAAGIKVGTRYLLRFRGSKTAAGTAAPVISIRFGTAQSTADTARLTFTLRAQTAAADEGIFDAEVIFTAAGATATLGGIAYSSHRQSTTGFSNAVLGEAVATGTSFDSTVASSYIGASVNGGAAAAWTVTFKSAMLLGTN